jgi:hypothetical protein
VILIAVGLVAGVLIALDVQRNLGAGSATTVFRTYSRQHEPRAFWTVVWIKVIMSAALAILSSALIVRDSA